MQENQQQPNAFMGMPNMWQTMQKEQQQQTNIMVMPNKAYSNNPQVIEVTDASSATAAAAAYAHQDPVIPSSPAAIPAAPENMSMQTAPSPSTPTAVATALSNALQQTNAPQNTAIVAKGDINSWILKDAGAGLEDADATSYSLPYMTIIQPQSTIITDALANGRTDVQPGCFYNTVTREVYKELIFLPCHYKRVYQRFNRDTKTYEGAYPVSMVEGNKIPGLIKDGFLYMIQNPNGISDLVDTRLHYVLYLNKSGQWEPAILALSKTQIKASKKLITCIKLIEFEVDGTPVVPPSWAIYYKATLNLEKNNKGSWYVWNFSSTNELVKDPSLYQKASALHKSISELDFNSATAMADNHALDDTSYDQQYQTQQQVQQYQPYQPQQQQVQQYQQYQPQQQVQQQQPNYQYNANLAQAQQNFTSAQQEVKEAKTKAEAAEENFTQAVNNAPWNNPNKDNASDKASNDLSAYQAYVTAHNS